jgi:hypothetical protein
MFGSMSYSPRSSRSETPSTRSGRPIVCRKFQADKNVYPTPSSLVRRHPQSESPGILALLRVIENDRRPHHGALDQRQSEACWMPDEKIGNHFPVAQVSSGGGPDPGRRRLRPSHLGACTDFGKLFPDHSVAVQGPGLLGAPGLGMRCLTIPFDSQTGARLHTSKERRVGPICFGDCLGKAFLMRMMENRNVEETTASRRDQRFDSKRSSTPRPSSSASRSSTT